MASLDPFPDMIKLSPSVYLYTPASKVHTSGTSEPRIIVLCAWMAAHPIHITKYIVGYQTLFPSSQILLIRSEVADIMYRSRAAIHRRIEPALTAIRSACSEEHSNPEILLHHFSNGGSQQSIVLLQEYLAEFRQLFPVHTRILDSCPGRGNFHRSYLALAASFDRQPAYLRWISSIFILTILCVYWILIVPLGIRNPIQAIWQGLNDKSNIRETRRVYIYSDTDNMVHWQEVEDHAGEAKEKGFDVQMEKFKGSGHAAHVRIGGGERYWNIVKSHWMSSTTDNRVS